jgi:hypothetical protein
MTKILVLALIIVTGYSLFRIVETTPTSTPVVTAAEAPTASPAATAATRLRTRYDNMRVCLSVLGYKSQSPADQSPSDAYVTWVSRRYPFKMDDHDWRVAEDTFWRLCLEDIARMKARGEHVPTVAEVIAQAPVAVAPAVMPEVTKPANPKKSGKSSKSR